MKNLLLIISILFSSILFSQTYHFDQVILTSEIYNETKVGKLDFSIKVDLDSNTVDMTTKAGTLKYKITKYLGKYKSSFVMRTEEEGGSTVKVIMYMRHFELYRVSDIFGNVNKLHGHYRIKK